MKFELIDRVLEQTDDRIVAVKYVSLAEEYLQDHFPSFPVLPGVMMIETMVQAARRLLAGRGDARLVLGEVKTLKFASFVRPGEALEVEVALVKPPESGVFLCRGTGRVRRFEEDAVETAVSGRFTMRSIRTVKTSVPKPPETGTSSV